jgi:hypothetical protein
MIMAFPAIRVKAVLDHTIFAGTNRKARGTLKAKAHADHNTVSSLLRK